MESSPPALVVVMPVYNEQASIRKVVQEWFAEIENWTEDFQLLVVEDGSTDGTPLLLERLRERLGIRLRVHRHANRGHGQSCLVGYRLAVETGTPHIFQVDSDGQCDPQYFFRFWRLRESYDVLYGNRKRRDDGLMRMLATQVLRLALLFRTSLFCVDANVPYRLMRSDAVRGLLDKIPADFFLANVALAVLLRRDPAIRHGTIPIGFRERYGGEPFVPLGKFGGRALELVRQLGTLPA